MPYCMLGRASIEKVANAAQTRMLGVCYAATAAYKPVQGPLRSKMESALVCVVNWIIA